MPPYKKKHPWYTSRKYLHFDQPIGFEKARKIVSSPSRVASHSFYPFIGYEVLSKKIFFDKSLECIQTKEKNRPIKLSAHIDSHIYSYYSMLISKKYEAKVVEYGIESNVLAFRSLGKSNIEFANDAFNEIKRRGECAAVAFDFSKFFDKIDHAELKKAWMNLLGCTKLPDDHYAVFRSLTKFSEVDKKALYELLSISVHNPRGRMQDGKIQRFKLCSADEFRNKVRSGGLINVNRGIIGIPQGSPISALLSNVYMLDYDVAAKEYVQKIGGTYFRYCDDMLFIIPMGSVDSVKDFVSQKSAAIKAEINDEKTEIREFKFEGGELFSSKPLQYLGFLFDGRDTYLRSSSLARYSERMKAGVKLAKKTMYKRNKLRKDAGDEERSLFKRKLYSRYSHLGGRNFVTYG